MVWDKRMIQVNGREYETITIDLEDDNWEY